MKIEPLTSSTSSARFNGFATPFGIGREVLFKAISNRKASNFYINLKTRSLNYEHRTENIEAKHLSTGAMKKVQGRHDVRDFCQPNEDKCATHRLGGRIWPKKFEPEDLYQAFDRQQEDFRQRRRSQNAQRK